MISGTNCPRFKSGAESIMSRRKTVLFHIRLQAKLNI